MSEEIKDSVIILDPPTINILGTPYKLIEQSEKENPKLEDACGLCEQYSKRIILADYLRDPSGKMAVENPEEFRKKVLRHEIIHAFLGESGLRCSSEWAENEEMVDWFAIQFEKIHQAFVEAGALEDAVLTVALPDDPGASLERLAKALSCTGISVSSVKGDMDWVDERS